jgi:hypothetical protein
MERNKKDGKKAIKLRNVWKWARVNKGTPKRSP